VEKNHLNNKTNRSKAIRRLVIWYRRNSAVTSLVDTATSSATAASNVAGTVVSNAGSVVTNAGSIARSTLEPFVFDPLRRLQGGESTEEKMEFKIQKGFGSLSMAWEEILPLEQFLMVV